MVGKPLKNHLWELRIRQIKARITKETCTVCCCSHKLWWIVFCFLRLPKNLYFWLCSQSELWAHDSPIQGGNHLGFIGDVFPNHANILGAQTPSICWLLVCFCSLRKENSSAISCSKAPCSAGLLSPDPGHPCCGSSQQDVLMPSDKFCAYPQNSATWSGKDRAFPTGCPRKPGKGGSSCLPLSQLCTGAPSALGAQPELTWSTQGLLNPKQTDPCTCWNLHEKKPGISLPGHRKSLLAPKGLWAAVRRRNFSWVHLVPFSIFNTRFSTKKHKKSFLTLHVSLTEGKPLVNFPQKTEILILLPEISNFVFLHKLRTRILSNSIQQE